MKILTRISTVLVLTVFSFASISCSHFSKTARQQRAYNAYIRHSSVAQARRSAKFRPGKTQMPPMPMTSDPVVNTATGPESVTSSSGEQ